MAKKAYLIDPKTDEIFVEVDGISEVIRPDGTSAIVVGDVEALKRATDETTKRVSAAYQTNESLERVQIARPSRIAEEVDRILLNGQTLEEYKAANNGEVVQPSVLEFHEAWERHPEEFTKACEPLFLLAYHLGEDLPAHTLNVPVVKEAGMPEWHLSGHISPKLRELYEKAERASKAEKQYTDSLKSMADKISLSHRKACKFLKAEQEKAEKTLKNPNAKPDQQTTAHYHLQEITRLEKGIAEGTRIAAEVAKEFAKEYDEKQHALLRSTKNRVFATYSEKSKFNAVAPAVKTQSRSLTGG